MHFDFEQRFYFANRNRISVTHVFKINAAVSDLSTHDCAVVPYYNKVPISHSYSPSPSRSRRAVMVYSYSDCLQ